MRAIVLVLGMIGLVYGTPVSATPLFEAQAENVTITLHDDACALPAVTNLKKRAVWREGGADVEGCWGLSPLGLVLFYFADKTVAAAPRQIFRPASNT